MSSHHESEWQWVGIAILDKAGNLVSWELKEPHGFIDFQTSARRGPMGPEVDNRLRLQLNTPMVKRWDGVMPNQPVAIAQYPPLPLESD